MKKTSKRLLSVLLVAVMLLGAAPVGGKSIFVTKSVAATEEYAEGYYTYEVESGEATITDVDTSISGDIVIPSTLGGYPVTRIGMFAFEDCTDLTSITIPDGVTSIDSYAFNDCAGLTSITIPDGVTSIGSSAFKDCNGLTSINVDEGNTVYDSRNNCNAIIETETNTLVQGCRNTVISSSVTSIGEYSFYGCDDLTNITIPNSVTSIGDYAFWECSDLINITMPDSGISIGACAFKYTKYYNEDSNWENGVLYIGNHLIQGKPTLVYGEGALSGAYEIKAGTKTIGDYAFIDCSLLTSLMVPDSVTSIGKAVFGLCSNLLSIKVDEGNTVYDSRDNCNAIIEIDTNTLVAGCKNTDIPDSVTSIGEYAFYWCTGLTSITIPNSVTSVGEGAFSMCAELISITIGNGVTSIGEMAFACCDSLTSMTIPDSVTSIGERAFILCTGLTSITIGNGVTSIGEGAFFYCQGLTSITIPKSVTDIYMAAFYECEKLTDVYYTGSEEDWNKINIDNTEDGNYALLNATIHFNYVPDIPNDFILTDENTGIKIEYSTELDNDTEIFVDEIFDGESLQLISTVYGEVKTKLFNISLQKDGEKVQPSGEVTVKIPVPAGFEPSKIFVTYVDSENGTVTKIPCEVKDGYVIFKTDHFSEYAIVEQLGGVESVSISNVTMDYKSSKTLTPEITADDGAEYTITYSSDSKNVTVDENGKIYAAKRGTANITVTVTDSQGNVVTDTCKVEVKYTWWQWLIKIVLFGWIWY